MKRKNLAKILGATLLLAGISGSESDCEEKQSTPQIPLEVYVEVPATESSRYKVKLVATFEDDLAYGKKRGIYEITDTQTNREYFGISGIGITELGDHSSGKSRVKDER